MYFITGERKGVKGNRRGEAGQFHEATYRHCM